MKIEKTNEELVTLIQSGIDVQENMTLLLEQNKGFIYNMVRKYSKLLKSSVVDFDDLRQDACLGLITAVESWNVNQKVTFLTYAKYQIAGSIRDTKMSVLYNKRIPNHIFSLIRSYEKFRGVFYQTNGTYPSDKECIQHLGISEKRYKDFQTIYRELQALNMDGLISSDSDDTLADLIADSVSVEETVLDEERKTVIQGCVESLGGKKTDVIFEKYYNNMNNPQIAKKIGVSRQHIDRLEEKALNLLYEMSEIQALRDNFDYQSAGLRGTGFAIWKDTGESSVERTVIKKIEKEAELNAKIAIIESSLSKLDEEKRKIIESQFKHPYKEVLSCVIRLPEKSMEIFILFYLKGLRQADISKQLKISWRAVYERIKTLESRVEKQLAEVV